MMKRGPYKKRKGQYQEARRLRGVFGYGYRIIAQKIDVPFGTVRHWVQDIPAPDAHQRAIEVLHPFEGLSTDKAVRGRLIKERGYRCESCSIGTWMGEHIVLEIHHIDGDTKNNCRGNLKLLCPNCHSQTPNYRNYKAHQQV